jgi:hypothetical protein
VVGAGVLVAVLAGCGASSSGEVSPVAGQPSSTPTGGGTGTSTSDPSPVAGTGGAATSPVANGPVNGPSSGSAKTRLKVVYNDGAGKVSTWTLTCDPTGGTLPHAALACRTLAAHGKQGLAPVPKGMMCPQIFSGAQTATITGSWNGTAVDASLKRSNGCETGRWRALQGLLPSVPINGAQ